MNSCWDVIGLILKDVDYLYTHAPSLENNEIIIHLPALTKVSKFLRKFSENFQKIVQNFSHLFQ